MRFSGNGDVPRGNMGVCEHEVGGLLRKRRPGLATTAYRVATGGWNHVQLPLRSDLAPCNPFPHHLPSLAVSCSHELTKRVHGRDV